MSETEDYDKSATPTAHKTTHQDGGSDEINVDALEGSLAEAQISTWDLVGGKPTTFTPAAHKASHQDAGSDEISVQGLAGVLPEAQPSTWALVSGKPTTFAPEAHKTNHQDAGSDEISVQGLAGLLFDDQHVLDAEAVSAMGTKANSNPLNHDRYSDSEALAAAVQAGAITDAVTKAPTHDAVYDVKVMTEAHKTRHQDAGLDEISVAALSGLLADDQHVLDTEVLAVASAKTHGATHLSNGSDPIGLPKFSAHKNGVSQTDIANGVETKVTFATEVYDLGSIYDAPNSRCTPGILGIFHVDAAIRFIASVDQLVFSIRIYLNGILHKGFSRDISGTAGGSFALSCDIKIDAITDYLEVYAFQASGVDQGLYGNTAYAYFMGHMLP